MKVYTYKACGSCQKAIKWLRARDISFEEVAIRECPPSLQELRWMLDQLGGNVGKLFNTSGRDYRAMNLKDKLPKMSEGEALNLLASEGNLVKRPFVVSKAKGLVGFNETLWEEQFGK